MQENIKHSITLEQKKSLTISGVESVASFSEVKITLRLLGGERLQIVGLNLKIIGFSKTNGTFQAEGEFTGISYAGKSFVSKIFK